MGDSRRPDLLVGCKGQGAEGESVRFIHSTGVAAQINPGGVCKHPLVVTWGR